METELIESYQKLLALLRGERKALESRNLEQLAVFAPQIQRYCAYVSEHADINCATSSEESQLKRLLSELKQESENSRQAWLDYQLELQSQQSELSSVRRYFQAKYAGRGSHRKRISHSA